MLVISLIYSIYFFFVSGYPVASSVFVEKTILSLFNCLGTFVENQFTTNVRIYVWTLNSIPMICNRGGKIRSVGQIQLTTFFLLLIKFY